MAKTNYYFDTFGKMIDYSVQAADYLVDILKDFDISKIGEYRRTLHRIENEEDHIRHDMMEQLMKEFMPPIDREDIIEIANRLDSVTDDIEDILIHIYMYNITEIRPEAIALAEVIAASCKELKRALDEFHNFAKYPPNLKDAFRKVGGLEEDGDLLYINAIHKLISEDKNTPQEILAWSTLFETLETACDSCDVVTDAMEMVVLKNS